MGLDMYLQKHSYVKNWSRMGETELHDVTVKKGGKERTDILPERVSYIVEEVAYWRKFNALHDWFVKNVADDSDDCKPVYVSKQQLKELHETLLKVKNVLDNATIGEIEYTYGWQGENDLKAVKRVYLCEDEINDLFPPVRGFFFGSTDIDEWYKEDVDSTIVVLDGLLKEIEDMEKMGVSFSFYYQASW